MTKIAGLKTTKEEKVSAARRAFILGLLDMGWRIATVFLIPVIVGVAFDWNRNGSQTFTIAGVVVGVILALAVIIKLAFDTNKIR